MSIGLIPYGKLAGGKYGILVDDTTGNPLAASVEVLNGLPLVASSDNFNGRTVFSTADSTMYVFTDDPSPQWIALEGVPADVGAVAGNPPSSPTPIPGSLFWDTDTEVAFIWDGSVWEPIGGRYATQLITQRYIGDGTSTNFPIGVTATVSPEYVEIFLDGVRQSPNPGGSYSVVGTNVVFSSPVPNGVEIFMRTMVSDTLVQNAQVFSASYTASPGDTTFSIGVPGIDPASAFVFVDGQVRALNIDYTVSTLDTTITGISKIGATTARFTMANPHGMAVGFDFRVDGTSDSLYRQTFSVTNVVSPNQVDATVDAAAPASATPDPVMFYTPSYTNDEIVFSSPLSGGEIIDIRSFKNIVTAPSLGEANTLASVGAGTSIAAGKAGATLQTKSIVAGPNVNVSSTSTEVTIGVSSILSFEDRVGINTNNYVVNGPESYVGVRNTTNPVVVDLSGIPFGSGSSGRRITIKDESGGASINNIQVVTGGPLIDGGGPSYTITTNYGAVSMVFDGNAWYVISTHS